MAADWRLLLVMSAGDFVFLTLGISNQIAIPLMDLQNLWRSLLEVTLESWDELAEYA
ncbi:MAG: hypothetical protein WBA22_12130 [Candidatus Methanofastidiosia archaeon]